MDQYMEVNDSFVYTSLNFSLPESIYKLTRTRSVKITDASVNMYYDIYFEWRFILPPFVLIFLLAVIGNSMVIVTLASNKKMRTVTNLYLLNLAVSDLMLGVFCLPFTLVGQILKRFLFGHVMCKIVPYLQAVAVTVDVWTLVAISLERYFAICKPLTSRRWQTQCHAYKMIALVWLCSLMFNSPILYASTLQPMKVQGFKCREVWAIRQLEKAFNLSLDAALLVLPFFVLTIAYILIVNKLWKGMRKEIKHNFNWQHMTRNGSCKSCKNITPPVVHRTSPEYCDTDGNYGINSKNARDNAERTEQEIPLNQRHCIHSSMELDFRHAIRSTHIDKSIKQKRKVIRMLFVIIIEFFVCWTPLHVINTIYLFSPGLLYGYLSPKGIICLQMLAYCSSCSNPITYCFMNKKFRLAFVNLVKLCRIFRCCFSEDTDITKVATPQPSSQEVTNCAVRNSQATGRSELGVPEGEDCV